MNSTASASPPASSSASSPTLLMVGLGRMGANMARRLAGAGAVVHGYDRSAESRAAVEETGDKYPIVVHQELAKAVAALPSPRMVWLMLPAGTATRQTIEQLLPMLQAADVVIDGGNANYLDSQAQGRELAAHGIEYGMMQALAEGFALLAGKPEFDLKLAGIGELWRHGSVVRSWLLDLTAQALEDPDAMDKVAPVVADSGEGRWTIDESMRQGTPVPVIAMAMMSRFDSQGKADTGNKLLALMRKGFGGHAITTAANDGKK